jgi:signal peptidase I
LPKVIMKSKKKMALFIAILLLVGAGLVSLLFFRFVKVPTGAMKNTILPGDRLLVKRSAEDLQRGDIIIFKFPKDNSIQYIQRVIGLPGETIQVHNQKVFINGTELAEKRAFYVYDDSFETPEQPLKAERTEGEGAYTAFYQTTEESFEAQMLGRRLSTFGITEPFEIPQGHYFALGDSRDDSEDSRYWGTVAKELITGKPLLIYASVEKPLTGGEKIRWERVCTTVK